MAGKRIAGITIEIGGDTTKLSDSLRSVDSALRTTQASLKDVDKLLKIDPKNTELLRQKQELLSKAIDQTSDRLKKLKEASEQAAKSAGNYDAWKTAYTPIKEEIDATTKKLRELKDQQKAMKDAGQINTDAYKALTAEIKSTAEHLKDLKAKAKEVSDEFGNPISPEKYDALQREIAETEHNLSDLKAESKGAGDALDDMGNQSVAAGDKLKVLGDAAAAAAKAAAAALAAATTAVAGFVKSSADVGREFDAAMSQVAATLGLSVADIQNNVDGAGDTFDLLKAKALEMGSSTNYTAKEAAEGLNILAMSGYDAQTSVGMIEDVLHLAAAGGMDLASAAGYVSGAMKGFADDTKSAQYYADLMAKGATLANTSVSQLGDALSSGAAGAAAYNQSAESMALSMLRLAEQGDVGTAAATAYAAVLKNLYTPTQQAQKALEELRINAYDPMTGAARDANEVINELAAALSGMSDAEANTYKNTIFGIQGLDAFNKMTVTSLDTQAAWAEALAGASGSMDDFRAALETSGVDWSKYGDAVWAAGGAVEGVLSDMVYNLRDAGASAEELQEYLTSEYDMSYEDAALAVASLSTALKDSGAAAEQYATMTDNLEGDLASLGSAFEGLQLAVYEQVEPAFRDFAQFGTESLQQVTSAFREGGLEGAMDALGPLIEDGIALLLEQVPVAVDAGGQLLGAVVNGLISNLPLLADGAIQIVSGLVTSLTESAPSLLSQGAELLSMLVDGIMTGLPLITESAVNLFENFGTAIEQNLPTIIEQGLTMVSGLSASIRENAGLLVDGAISLALSLAKGLADSIPTIIQNVPTIVTNIAGVINDNAPKLIAAGVNILITLGKGLIQAIPTLIANIPQIITAIYNVFTAFNWLSLGSSIITAIGNGIKALATSIPTAIKGIMTAGRNAIINTDWLSVGSGIISKIVSGVSALTSAIPNALKAIATAGMNAIKSIDWLSVGKAIVNGIIKGVTALGGAAVEAVKGIGRSMLNGAKSLLGIASPSKEFAWVGEMVAKGLAKGITDNATAAETAAEKLAKNVYSAVSTAAERQIKYEQLTLSEQLALWREIQSQFAAETDQWYSARDKVLDLEEKVAAEKARAIKDTYNGLIKGVEYVFKRQNTSLAGQLSAYEQIRNQFVKGSEEWLAADEKVFDARQALLKSQAQAWKDYYSDISKVNKSIASLQDDYAKTVENRTKQIAGSYKLFDEVPAAEEVSSKQLMRNLQRQIRSVESFYTNLDKLAERGVSAGLVDEIRQMGVGASDELRAILSMTDKQLMQYSGLFDTRQSQANEIAVKELESLKDDTEKQIREQLATVASLYDKYAPQLGEAFPEGLASGILAKKDAAVEAAVEVAKAVEEVVRQQTETHSPSKLFARIAGEGWIGGMVKGVKDGAGSLRTALSDTLAASTKTLNSSWANNLRSLIDAAGTATETMAAGLVPPARPPRAPAYAGGYGEATEGYATSAPGRGAGATYNWTIRNEVGGRTVARRQQTYTEAELTRRGESLIRVN